MRVLVGTMVLYTHIVWSIGLESFALTDRLIPVEFVRNQFGDSPFFWSHLFGIESPTTLWIVHIIALIIFLMFAVGLFTRVTSVLSFLLIVSYANRLAPAQFGLDQINAFLTLYLAIGPSGAAFSVDNWLRKKKKLAPIDKSISANIAIRLIQLHMCVIYLFAGLSKLRGETWVGGDAIWGALASYEYQTLDMTWMANYFWMINLLTLVTVVWEVSYFALIWNRITRPIYLLIAVGTHLGIGFCMGMITFGLIMLIGNMAFLSPAIFDLFRKNKPLGEIETSQTVRTKTKLHPDKAAPANV
jgi:hypothetical protein